MKNKKLSILLLIFFAFIFSSFAYSYSPVNSDSTKSELRGDIQSKKGNTINVSITFAESQPQTGTTGTLSKYFEEEVLGFYTHGYFDIAEVEVLSVTESEITFTLIKELSKITVNGKKENHFKKGTIVKFEW
jgi:hypothetical protein